MCVCVSDTLLSAPLNVTIREIEVNSAVVTWEISEGDPVIGFAITQQVPPCVSWESELDWSSQPRLSDSDEWGEMDKGMCVNLKAAGSWLLFLAGWLGLLTEPELILGYHSNRFTRFNAQRTHQFFFKGFFCILSILQHCVHHILSPVSLRAPHPTPRIPSLLWLVSSHKPESAQLRTTVQLC